MNPHVLSLPSDSWSGSNPPLHGSPTGFSPTDCCLLQAGPGVNQSFVLIYLMPAVFLFLKLVTQYSSLHNILMTFS